MQKILNIYKIHKQKFLYVFFGLCTTIANFVAYLFASRICDLKPTISTLFAWFIAVSFAYITNRKWVFISNANRAFEITKETLLFYVARIATGIFEVGAMWLFAEVLRLYDIAVKVALIVLITIGNYILNKFVVFRIKNGSKI